MVTALSARGRRVAAIKHCPHGHDLDRTGSDTNTFYRAGALTVVAASPDRITRVDRTEGETPLESIVASLGTLVDIVVAEGFKSSTVPKVLILDGVQPPPSVQNVIATIGAHRHAEANDGVPEFEFEDVDRLADLLCDRFF